MRKYKGERSKQKKTKSFALLLDKKHRSLHKRKLTLRFKHGCTCSEAARMPLVPRSSEFAASKLTLRPSLKQL